MSDDPLDRGGETPADAGGPESREPPHYETHAPRLEREPAAGDFGRGVGVALGMAAVFTVMDVIAVLLVVGYSVGGTDSMKLATWISYALVALAAGTAVVVSRRLPRAARASFWATGTVCTAFVLIFLVGVCGLNGPGIGG
jgi:hypothetical protein